LTIPAGPACVTDSPAPCPVEADCSPTLRPARWPAAPDDCAAAGAGDASPRRMAVAGGKWTTRGAPVLGARVVAETGPANPDASAGFSGTGEGSAARSAASAGGPNAPAGSCSVPGARCTGNVVALGIPADASCARTVGQDRFEKLSASPGCKEASGPETIPDGSLSLSEARCKRATVEGDAPIAAACARTTGIGGSAKSGAASAREEVFSLTILPPPVAPAALGTADA